MATNQSLPDIQEEKHREGLRRWLAGETSCLCGRELVPGEHGVFVCVICAMDPADCRCLPRMETPVALRCTDSGCACNGGGEAHAERNARLNAESEARSPKWQPTRKPESPEEFQCRVRGLEF